MECTALTNSRLLVCTERRGNVSCCPLHVDTNKATSHGYTDTCLHVAVQWRIGSSTHGTRSNTVRMTCKATRCGTLVYCSVSRVIVLLEGRTERPTTHQMYATITKLTGTPDGNGASADFGEDHFNIRSHLFPDVNVQHLRRNLPAAHPIHRTPVVLRLWKYSIDS